MVFSKTKKTEWRNMELYAPHAVLQEGGGGGGNNRLLDVSAF